jgi:hypothetical protein
MSAEQDGDIEYYLEQVRLEKQQDPSSLRKSVIWNTKTDLAKRIFGWNKTPNDPQGYNYSPTRAGRRVETNDVPVAGTKAGDLEAGASWANPTSDQNGSLRARLSKLQ